MLLINLTCQLPDDRQPVWNPEYGQLIFALSLLKCIHTHTHIYIYKWKIIDISIPKFNKNISYVWHFVLVWIAVVAYNRRGVWNKALSDFWCNVKFSWSFTTEYKDIWKENLVIYQKSLKAFLQVPLQLQLPIIPHQCNQAVKSSVTKEMLINLFRTLQC